MIPHVKRLYDLRVGFERISPMAPPLRTSFGIAHGDARRTRAINDMAAPRAHVAFRRGPKE